MRILFLDDFRNGELYVKELMDEDCYPNKEIFQVYNYEQFTDWIEKNDLPDWIFFDHDLGEEKTGYDAAKWLINYCMSKNVDIPNYQIQSSNIVGKMNIHNALKCYSEWFKEQKK